MRKGIEERWFLKAADAFLHAADRRREAEVAGEYPSDVQFGLCAWFIEADVPYNTREKLKKRMQKHIHTRDAYLCKTFYIWKSDLDNWNKPSTSFPPKYDRMRYEFALKMAGLCRRAAQRKRRKGK